MKIKQLKLTNIGPFLNEHVFSFSVENSQKNIVLIGGRNGAGKTTIFESIRLCLYGYKLYGYRQNSQTYINKIKKLINDTAKSEAPTFAGINIQLLIEDGYANEVFEIGRHWVLSGKDIKEDLTVRKGIQLLNFEEMQDFENYLLQMIPPALFNFHFLNGEKIVDFIFDHTNGQSFRKAFLQICGLDTFDLLEDQLENNVRNQNHNQNNNAQIIFDTAKEELFAITSFHKEIVDIVTSTQKEIDFIEDQIAILDKAMMHYGGVEGNEWQIFQKILKEEELKREELRYTLKNSANDIIPFIILKKELIALKQQLIIEEQLKRNRLFKERLFNDQVQQKLAKELTPYLLKPETALSEEFISALYSVMKENCPTDETEFLHLSENEYMTLLTEVNRYLDYDIQKIFDLEHAINNSLKHAKEIREKMDSKEVIDSEHYLSRKNELLMHLDMTRKQLLKSQIDLIQTEKTMQVKEKAYDKAYANYKAILKNRSVNDMTARALLAFSELKQRLYAKYIAMVEASFSVNFNRLISKKDLIDGIYISSAFEVIAYKNSEISVSDVLKQVKKYGKIYVENNIGERAFDLISESNCSNDIISVPLKVEQHFSTGEKQIFVMALYQSLTKIRVTELPFIIDTPLARIDHEHRENILLNFFAQLSGQVIILSTDEEIKSANTSLINQKISDTYLLEHKSGGISTVNENSYFKEVSN